MPTQAAGEEFNLDDFPKVPPKYQVLVGQDLSNSYNLGSYWANLKEVLWPRSLRTEWVNSAEVAAQLEKAGVGGADGTARQNGAAQQGKPKGEGQQNGKQQPAQPQKRKGGESKKARNKKGEGKQEPSTGARKRRSKRTKRQS